MTYLFDKNKFDSTFQITEKNTKARHNTGRYFRLFPYKTKDKANQVVSVQELIGRYFCQLQECKGITITFDELLPKILSKVGLDSDQNSVEDFKIILRDLFFDENGKIKLSNPKLLYLLNCPKDQAETANFLSDVLGKRARVKEILDKSIKAMDSQANVLENLVVSLLSPEASQEEDRTPYFQVVTQFNELFESDLEFILQSVKRTQESLVDLLHLYYFTYVAQTALQLNNFLKGNRTQCVPIYFALEWERTSQRRQCCREGWKRLFPSIKSIFTHAFVLELLNQTKEEESLDYIALAEIIKNEPEKEREITEQVKLMCDTYRDSIDDCKEMRELVRSSTEASSLAKEIEYLFQSVDCQFTHTTRSNRQTSYANGFIGFCKEQFVQSRGPIGPLLILSETYLILLTKLAIKDKEKLRLNEVFKEFEKRGFFLDPKSKVCAMEYFEKLNLIEKKSDSGDAQYVKQIL